MIVNLVDFYVNWAEARIEFTIIEEALRSTIDSEKPHPHSVSCSCTVIDNTY